MGVAGSEMSQNKAGISAADCFRVNKKFCQSSLYTFMSSFSVNEELPLVHLTL